MNESTASMGMMILWMVVIFGVMYFLMIRPQKKEQKRLQAMLNSMEVDGNFGSWRQRVDNKRILRCTD